MADDVELTEEREARTTELVIKDICRCNDECKKGIKGECFYCGETFERVVEVEDRFSEQLVLACGRCRDIRGLK